MSALRRRRRIDSVLAASAHAGHQYQHQYQRQYTILRVAAIELIRVIGTPRAQSVVGHALLTTTTNDRDLPVHLQVSAT